MPVKCCRCVWRITQPSGGGFELDFHWNFARLTNQKIKKNWTQNRVKYKAKKKKIGLWQVWLIIHYGQIFNLSSRCLATICDLSQSQKRRQRETATTKLVEHAHTHVLHTIYCIWIYTEPSLSLSLALCMCDIGARSCPNRLRFLFTFSLTISRLLLCVLVFGFGFSFFWYHIFLLFLSGMLFFFSTCCYLCCCCSDSLSVSEIVKNSAVPLRCKEVKWE